jgi:hypothetical protein
MADPAKFGLLRKVLRAVGLSEAAVNDLIDWITDRLADDQLDKQIQAHVQEEGVLSEAAPVVFPYRIRDDFMSPAERSFYHVLKGVVGTRYLIAPKVGLADLFYVKSGDPREYRVFTNKIDRKHVDFVLCDLQNLAPLAGIELDDKSHEREDRKQRDDFVEGVFAAAGLKLLRIRVQRGYQPQEVAAMLDSVLSSESDGPAPAPIQFVTPSQIIPSESPPTNGLHSNGEKSVVIASPPCPKCGSEMVLRTAKKGNNEGQQFWGCSNFPRCRTMIPYERVAV